MNEFTVTPIKQPINGTISEAINSYEAKGVPLSQLLTDFNDVITNPDLLKTAVNPWESINKKKGVSVVCSVSALETKFIFSAMSLYKQRPISVIKSIYYRNNMRNDSALERIFLGIIFEEIPINKNLLIINPSPFVVEAVEKIRKGQSFAVIDETMASLYSKQYKHSRFVPIDSINSITGEDVAIIFTNCIDEKSLQKTVEYIGFASVERIYGIFQIRMLNNKNSLFWRALSEGHYKINNIIIVPKEVSKSSPKNKCLIWIQGNSKKTEVVIQKMDYDDRRKMVSLDGKKQVVSYEDLIGCKTLNLLWKRSSIKRKEKKKEYAKFELYAFSQEIQISYAIYHDKTGSYAKAYYAATKLTHQPTVRGKALTPRTERGLHAKSEDLVIEALKKIPYNKTMAEAIIDDITINYLDMGIPVSLKTLWFCLRGMLQKNVSYDDAAMIEMFTNNTISDLYPDRDTGDAFRRAVEEQLEEGEDVKELKLLKMLNLIISEAINKGYLHENRILPLIPVAQNRATKRQKEVRQALTKRSFEGVEERKIMEYLMPFYTKSSTFLAVVIRLMTGISIREACGLLWSDFQYDKTLNIFRLSITKFVDSNAKIIHHVMNDDWEKYRVLPISFLLGEMIMARKKYLNKEGLDDEVLEEYPIILHREDLSRIRKGYRPIYCKPSSVAEKCREAVKAAEIPQLQIILPDGDGNELETDLNSYGGDIFRSNFRDKALNAAGFELDEMNYYLGIKRPDTFSQHYCDYTNQYVQLQMARKLDRWAERYEFGIKTEYSGMSTTRTINGIGDGVPCAEIEIDKNDAENDAITIRVESMHGFNVSVATYKRRSNDA